MIKIETKKLKIHLLCKLFGHKWEYRRGNDYFRSTACYRCSTPRDRERMKEMILDEDILRRLKQKGEQDEEK